MRTPGDSNDDLTLFVYVFMLLWIPMIYSWFAYRYDLAPPEPVVAACTDCVMGTHDVTGKPITVTVTFLHDMQEVSDMAESLGHKFHNPRGFATWRETRKGIECDIYSIHPRTENGPNMLVLGHEIMHCVMGNFHE